MLPVINKTHEGRLPIKEHMKAGCLLKNKQTNLCIYPQKKKSVGQTISKYKDKIATIEIKALRKNDVIINKVKISMKSNVLMLQQM